MHGDISVVGNLGMLWSTPAVGIAWKACVSFPCVCVYKSLILGLLDTFVAHIYEHTWVEVVYVQCPCAD